MLTVKFEYAPGDLVDVPHLCIDAGLIKLALVGVTGGKGYLIETVSMGKPFTLEVFESCVCPPRIEEDDE